MKATMIEKPNIILILTDSQGWNLIGRNNYIHTPNLHKLSETGVTFNRAYNVCPLCTPARAGTFTGEYPHNAGAWSNDMPLWKNIRTLGEYLQKTDYETAYMGKWYLDGFDYFGQGEAPEGYDADF